MENNEDNKMAVGPKETSAIEGVKIGSIMGLRYEKEMLLFRLSGINNKVLQFQPSTNLSWYWSELHWFKLYTDIFCDIDA